MKVIVAGGRDFEDRGYMEISIQGLIQKADIPRDFELVCGMARGADMVAYTLCKKKGNILHEFPADWDRYGKGAGHRRNREMGDFADCLIAFWDGESKGTKGMIDYMRKLGKPVFVFHY